MRIAYLTSLYGRASDSFVRLEVRLLRAKGHDVSTYSVNKPPESEAVSEELKQEQARTEYILGTDRVRLLTSLVREAGGNPALFLEALALTMRRRAPGAKGFIRSAAYLVEATYLAGLLRRSRVEHLHNHIAENSATVAMLASVLTGIPFSMTVHGPSEWDRPMDLALDEKVHRSAFVAAISDYTRSQLMRWSRKEDWPRLRVVRCGLEKDFLNAAPVPLPAENRLVFVGRLVDAKGPLLLIAALGILAREGVRFHLDVVGDGPLRQAMETAIVKEGLEEHVSLLGWRTGDQVREAMLASRLFVLPSLAEGLPVALMEALALRRAVISTYIAGIPELVKTGHNGWLVPPGSVPDLVSALRTALGSSTEELDRMGQAGHAAVRQWHDAVKEVDKLEHLFLNPGQPSDST